MKKIEKLVVNEGTTLGVGEFEVETALTLNEVIEFLYGTVNWYSKKQDFSDCTCPPCVTRRSDQELINQVLETETVKESSTSTTTSIFDGPCSKAGNGANFTHTGPCLCGQPVFVTPPSNSEKEECCKKCIPNFKIEFTGECPLLKICMKPDCLCHQPEEDTTEEIVKHNLRLLEEVAPELMPWPPKEDTKKECECGEPYEGVIHSKERCCLKPRGFYGKGQYEKGGYEYEKQEAENLAKNKAMEEPVKKPSERIREIQKAIFNEKVGSTNNIVEESMAMMATLSRAVVEYLDEQFSKK